MVVNSDVNPEHGESNSQAGISSKNQEFSNELVHITKRATITREIEQVIQSDHLPTVETNRPYPIIELRDRSTEEIRKVLEDLQSRTEIVFHGGKSDEPYDELDPSVSRLTGKPPSIYATTDPRVALVNAVIAKRPDIREQDAGVGFAASMNITDNAGPIFEAPPAMYDALQHLESSGIVTDGIVYVLPKFEFQISTSKHESGLSDHEYNSQHKIIPAAALLVPASVAQDLIVIGQGDKDTVFRYSNEQMQQYKAASTLNFINQLLTEDREYSGPELIAEMAKLPDYNDRVKDPAGQLFVEQVSLLDQPMTKQDLALELVRISQTQSTLS